MLVHVYLVANPVLVLWFDEDIGVLKDDGGPGGLELDFME